MGFCKNLTQTLISPKIFSYNYARVPILYSYLKKNFVLNFLTLDVLIF